MNIVSIPAGFDFTTIPTTYANSIWELEEDYDLGGVSVEIPEGVVLKFLHGIIRNGTLKGKNTCINSDLYQIFDKDILFEGTWNIEGIYPEWYGAKIDSGTDDFPAIQSAIIACANIKKNMVFSSGTYKINSLLGTIDFSKMSIIGNRTTIDCSGISASGSVINLQSIIKYPHHKNILSSLEGIALVGSHVPGVIGLSIGGNLSNNNDCVVNQCVIDNFETNVRFFNNAWRVKFTNTAISRAQKYHIYAPDSLTNYGECMIYDGCFIADGAGSIELHHGYHVFSNSSIDFVSVKGRSASIIKLTNCHIENPNQEGDTNSYYYIDCEDAKMNLQDCNIVMNNSNNGDERTIALFRCVTSNEGTNGLTITGSYLPQTGIYRPYGKEGSYSYVVGNGYVQFKDIKVYDGVDNGSLALPYSSAYQNYLNNGNAQLGNINGWNTKGEGTAEANLISPPNIDPKLYNFHLVGKMTFDQSLNVQTLRGSVATFGGQVKTISNTVYLYLQMLDIDDNVKINLRRSYSSNSWGDIAQLGLCHSIPNNVDKIRVRCFAPEDAECYLDDLVLCIF